jgi:hypothetical protein
VCMVTGDIEMGWVCDVKTPVRSQFCKYRETDLVAGEVNVLYPNLHAVAQSVHQTRMRRFIPIYDVI